MSDVAAFAQEFSLPPRPPTQERPSSPWTAERIERVKVLALAGRSCNEIAIDLGNGISRNAVIGKLNRLRLTTGNTKGTRGADRIARSSDKRSNPVTAKPYKIRSRLDAIFAGDEATELPPEQSDCAMTFRQAKDGDRRCRYPIGDSANLEAFRYCGAPQGDECGAYCARHFRFMHRRAPEVSAEDRQRRSLLGRRMAAKNNAAASVP